VTNLGGPLRVYEGRAASWARGPGPAYERLASAMVADLRMLLAGALVLDVGSGTGAACVHLARARARAVALDAAVDMLRHTGVPAVAGDGQRLPFRSGQFDAVVAGFCLSHMEAPQQALAEMRRVLRSGGRLAATAFASSVSAAKAAVEDTAAALGFSRPAWYLRIKENEDQVGDPERLRLLALAAGFEEVSVADLELDMGLQTPASFVDYRLGMPHTAAFVAGLPEASRRLLRETAIRALAGWYQPLRPRVVILSSRAPA